MRPLHLNMTAFGPFKNEEKIDFTELGENPLFLINGKTGAGKSTILDGICYALYGETTGKERTGSDMRCHHSDNKTLTEVTFTFELNGKRYQIKRVPDQIRASKRGDKEVKQSAEAYLHEIEDGEEKLIAGSKVTEVNEVVVAMTGLSGDQFRQVVVLPQGQFRKMLSAKSTEREEIFQKLFSTDMYRKLQEKLKARANEIKQQLIDAGTKQKAKLEALDLKSADALEEELKGLIAKLEKLEIKRKAAIKALEVAQKNIHDAQVIEVLFTEQDTAKQQYESLVVQDAEIKKEKDQLADATLAREIEPLYLDLNKAKASHQVNVGQIEAEKKSLESANTKLAALDEEQKSLPQDQKKIEAYTVSIAALEKIVVDVDGLTGAFAEVEKAKNAHTKSKKNATLLNQTLETDKKQKEEAEATLRVGMKEISVLAEKEQRETEMKEQGIQLKAKEDAQTEFIRIESEAKTLDTNIAKAQELFDKEDRTCGQLAIAWNNGQAAFLAKELKDGDACSVCGSTEHPQLAVSSEYLPTQDELNDAQKNVDDARESLETLKQQYAAKEQERKTSLTQLDELREKVKEFEAVGIEQRRADLKALQGEIKALKIQVEVNIGLEKTIETATNDIKTNEALYTEGQKKESELSTAYTVVNTTYEQKLKSIPEEFREEGKAIQTLAGEKSDQTALIEKVNSLAKRHQVARDRQIEIQTRLVKQEELKTQSEKVCNESEKKWLTLLEKHEIENEAQFSAMLMEKTDFETLEKHIREYDDNLLLGKEKLAEKTKNIEGKERADLIKLAESEATQTQVKNDAETEYHQSEQRHKQLTKLKAELATAAKESVELEKQYGVIGKLSGVVNGDNQYKTNLQRFVLSILLDDVLVAANVRLLEMSHYRYELYRNENVDDMRLQSGLDIIVQDNITGEARSANTLSGGESFMAALALALGLSDTVQAYSGGIRLDTLFIDEGFGSLDPESLENAVNILLKLKDSGRMVGVISHVDSMKQMINVKLNVMSDRGISHTSMTTV